MTEKRHKTPPPGAPIPLRIQSTPLDGVLIVRFLGPVRGIIVHWKSKKDVKACPGPESCPTAIHKISPRWKGFAPGEWWRDGQYQDWCPAVIEVTEHLWDQLEGAELRGTVWTLQRQINADAKKEVHGEQVQEIPEEYLRPAFSIEGTVQKAYKTPWVAFDVPRLFERCLTLSASAGAPPQIVGIPTAPEQPRALSIYDHIRKKVIAGTLSDTDRDQFGPMILKIQAELLGKSKPGKPVSTPHQGNGQVGQPGHLPATSRRPAPPTSR